eukprot:5897184-Pleurochrysis_carterae.AAC.2
MHGRVATVPFAEFNPTATASGWSSYGNSAASTLRAGSVGAAAPFRFPIARAPGSTSSLSAIAYTEADMCQVLPGAVACTCGSTPKSLRSSCLAAARSSANNRTFYAPERCHHYHRYLLPLASRSQCHKSAGRLLN